MEQWEENMSVWNERSDLFTSEAQIIAHGCNCRGAMGSGVAKIVRAKYPSVYHAYQHEHATNGLELGQVQFVRITDVEQTPRYIANCMTQDAYGTYARQINYEAMYVCLEKLHKFAKQEGIREIAIPKIGAGLAGGSWKIINEMVKDIFDRKHGIRITIHSID